MIRPFRLRFAMTRQDGRGILIYKIETVYIALVMGLWLGWGGQFPIFVFLPLDFHFIFFLHNFYKAVDALCCASFACYYRA